MSAHQHLRWLVVILLGVPAIILLVNAMYMQRYLTSQTTLEVPLNVRLAQEVVRLRYINSAREKELRATKIKFKEIRVTDKVEEEISVTIFAKFAYKRMKVLRNMVRCLGSILDHTSSPMHFHVLLDSPSKMRISRTLSKLMIDKNKKFKVSYHFLEPLSIHFEDTIKLFRHYFFTKDVGRYDDDIFFISQIFHKMRPFKTLDKLIMLDLDTKFRANILELWSQFDAFKTTELMAMAYDQQPQYRYDFALYRAKNPKSDVGGPHPGRQGFNTGVVLFNLKRMRDCKVYNELLKEYEINQLCEKYEFRGYMGHQDFYTLTLMEHPELYRVLNCSWNRQLDAGWRKSAGAEIFEQYHSCPGQVNVYHGNGQTTIPDN